MKRLTRIVVLSAAALAMLAPAAPASADETQLCYAVVVIDEMPYVQPGPNIGSPTHISTGGYHVEQNCIGPIGTFK